MNAIGEMKEAVFADRGMLVGIKGLALSGFRECVLRASYHGR